MIRDRFPGGLLVPVTSQTQRGPGRISLFFYRLTNRLTATLPDGSKREFGRLSEEEDASTKGDALISDGARFRRLAIGSNTHVLTADSTEATGVKWASAGGGGGGAAANDLDHILHQQVFS